MKKRLIALLMSTIMISGVLTGCGSENEVAEPKNDKEVVVEESNVAENDVDETISEENAISNEEGNTVNEEDKGELSFADLWTLASDCSENGRFASNPKGQITIFNVKLPASEEFVDEETRFDMYVVDTSSSSHNLQKGRVYDDVVEKWKYDISYDYVTKDYSNDESWEKCKVEIDPEQSVQTLNVRFIDDNDDGVADKIAFTYDSEGETNVIGYVNTSTTLISSPYLTPIVSTTWRFETLVSENGEDFVYYTVLEIPKSLANKKGEFNFVLGTKDEMMEETNVNVIEE